MLINLSEAAYPTTHRANLFPQRKAQVVHRPVYPAGSAQIHSHSLQRGPRYAFAMDVTSIDRMRLSPDIHSCVRVGLSTVVSSKYMSDKEFFSLDKVGVCVSK